MMDYLSLKLSEVSQEGTPERNSKMEKMMKMISGQYNMANTMKMKVKVMIKKEMANNQEKTLTTMTAISDFMVYLKDLIFNNNI